MSTLQHETTLTTLLTLFLDGKEGLKVTHQKSYKRGKGTQWIDVFCTTSDDYRIAIEAKRRNGNHKQAKDDAIKQADERLKDNACDASIAMIIPGKYNSPEDFQNGVTDICVRTRLTQTNNKPPEWKHNFKLSQLPKRIKHINTELSNPEELARIAQNAVDNAYEQFKEEDIETIPQQITDAVGYDPKENDTKKERAKKIQKTLKGMLTDITTAFLFQSKLDGTIRYYKKEFSNKEPPNTLRNCLHNNQTDIITSLIETFKRWLIKDYKDILIWVTEILTNLPERKRIKTAIKILAKAALKIHNTKGNKHHDIIGIIFCSSITEAKNTGAYYTTLPAATLAVHLMFQDISNYVWADYDRVTKIKIADFACGSGTLLIATINYILEKIEEFNPKIKNKVAIKLLEKCIYGFDINNRAKFQTATGLGMISPSTAFEKLNIHSMTLGKVTNKHGKKEGRIGYLELLNDKDELIPAPPITSDPIDREESIPEIKEGEFQFAIMNPPYTINFKRHKHLSQEEQKLVKSREKSFKQKYKHVAKTGNAESFFPVVNKFLNKNNGKAVFIMPSAFTTGTHPLGARKWLANNFHIKSIIIIYDPKNPYFSGNTDIGECIIVIERKRKDNKNKPTQIIKLTKNPTTENEAIQCAKSILKKTPNEENYIEDEISSEEIKNGNWKATQFVSNELYKLATQIKTHWVRNINNSLILLHNGRQIVGKETIKCGKSDKEAVPALYNHDVNHCNSLLTAPDKYLKAKDKSIKALTELCRVKIAWRPNFPTIKNFACLTTIPTVGSAWASAKTLKITNVDELTVEKAVVIILNSTIAKTSFMLNKTNKKQAYPNYGANQLAKISMPLLYAIKPSQFKKLAGVFDRYATTKRNSLPQSHNCKVQIEIDKAVCEVTNFPKNECDRMRILLSEEPMITGKKYEERHNLL